MEIKQENPAAVAEDIYEIVKHAFVRKFDKLPASVEEVIDFIGNSDVYVAYETSEPVGYFILQKIDDNNQELKSIAVHQSHQGKGIGNQLMNKALELSKNKNIKLFTHPKNNAALIMYLRHDFMINNWVNDYLGDGEPRLELIKRVK